MILNPYETSIGSHFNVKKLETTLMEFTIKNPSSANLNYEYINKDDVSLIFITGKNHEEVELPVWNHPLYIKDFRGNKKIFVDVRQYVKIKNTDFTDLKDVVSNKPGFDFIITKTLFMMLLDEDLLNSISLPITTAFSVWISTSFKSVLSLGIEDTIKMEILSAYYLYSNMIDGELTSSDIENVYFKISKSIRSVRNNIKYIKDVCSNINHSPMDAVDFVENIQKGIDSPLLSNINTTLLYTILGNTWNGVNAGENIAMTFDHIPTLIALLYVSANNKSFKHSKLANILNSNKRAIGLDNFSKTVELIISDQTMSM